MLNGPWTDHGWRPKINSRFSSANFRECSGDPVCAQLFAVGKTGVGWRRHSTWASCLLALGWVPARRRRRLGLGSGCWPRWVFGLLPPGGRDRLGQQFPAVVADEAIRADAAVLPCGPLPALGSNPAFPRAPTGGVAWRGSVQGGQGVLDSGLQAAINRARFGMEGEVGAVRSLVKPGCALFDDPC